jgi:hypothetical protein
MILTCTKREVEISMRKDFESFVKSAEGYSGVPDCGFAVCCLEKVLPEVARVKGTGQLGESVSAKKREAPTFLVIF